MSIIRAAVKSLTTPLGGGQIARSVRLKGRPQAKPGAGTLAERRRRDSEVPELTRFVRVW
jgi:hypothetical protein